MCLCVCEAGSSGEAPPAGQVSALREASQQIGGAFADASLETGMRTSSADERSFSDPPDSEGSVAQS